MDNLELLFDEFIDEAYDGIKCNGHLLKFHTLDKQALLGHFSDVPILIINNKKELINKLRTYLTIVLNREHLKDDKYNIKKCLSSLWINACYEDFSHPYAFIDNRINFYINDDFLNDGVVDGDFTLKRIEQSISKETPYAFMACLNEEYLPSISYGISNDTCYIYNITSDNIDDDKLSLSLFLKQLYGYGIGKIKVVSCLPMRKINDDILNIFDELACSYENIKVSSHPFEMDEYLNIYVSDFEKERGVI